MLTSERKKLLLDHLRRDGRIVAKKLSKTLGLSEDTIRRDLRELAAAGLLQRVHGGALPASPTLASLASRRTMSVTEKVILARAASRLIGAGQRIFLDGGTTNVELVRCLPHDLRSTIFTHSPTIAAALEPHTRINVILVGGTLYRHSMVTVGAETLRAVNELRVDVFFLGVNGVHATEGLTTGDFEEAAVKRAIIARAGETVTMVTTDKIGTVSGHHVADVSAVATIVVPKTADVKSLAGVGARLQRAG